MLLSDEEKIEQEKVINIFKKFEQKKTKEELNDFSEELSQKEYLSQDLKELLQYLVSFKLKEDYSEQTVQELTALLILKYKEKILTKNELIRLVFHLPCYIGQILNDIKDDLTEQDYSDLYHESLDFEEEYIVPIYDLNYENLSIDSKIDQEYLYKNYSLKRSKSDKNVS